MFRNFIKPHPEVYVAFSSHSLSGKKRRGYFDFTSLKAALPLDCKQC